MSALYWEKATSYRGTFTFSFVDYPNAEAYMQRIHSALQNFDASTSSAKGPGTLLRPAGSSGASFSKRRCSLSESRLAVVSAGDAPKDAEEEALIELAELLYTPVSVNVSLEEDEDSFQSLDTAAGGGTPDAMAPRHSSSGSSKLTVTRPAASVAEENSALDVWSSLYVATLTKAHQTLLLMLQFHVTHAPQLLRYLVRQRSRSLEQLLPTPSNAAADQLPPSSPMRLFTYVGETARTLFVDRSLCSSKLSRPTSVETLGNLEEAPIELDLDSFNVATVGRFALPFLEDLRTSANAAATAPAGGSILSPTAGGALNNTLGSSINLSAPPNVVALRNALDVARALVFSIHEQDGAAECLSPVDDTNDDSAQKSPLRRAQLYIEFESLFDEVCEKGNLDTLAILQRFVPIAPLVFVSISDLGLRHAVRLQNVVRAPLTLRIGAQAILLSIAPQEGEKLHFLDQALPELPTLITSLRRASSLFKAMCDAAAAGEDSTAAVAPALANCTTNPLSPHGALVSSKNRISYLHLSLIRLLLSRTVSPASFEECYVQIRKDLGDLNACQSAFFPAEWSVPLSVSYPVALPALFAACAAFRSDLEALSLGEHVAGKIRAVLNHPTIRQYFVSPPATDAERFEQLWAPETFYNDRTKKFSTRMDLLMNAVNSYGGRSAHHVNSISQYATNAAVAIATDNVFPWYRSIWFPWLTSVSQEVALLVSQQQQQDDEDGSGDAPTIAASTNKSSRSYGKATSSDERGVDPELQEISKRVVYHLNDIKKTIQRAEKALAANNNNNNSTGQQANGGAEESEEAPISLEEQFQIAEKEFGQIAARQPNSVKLSMYSLYKQATQGDVTGSRPWAMDVTGRAKYDAWATRKGMSSDQAKQIYVEQLHLILAGSVVSK